MVGRALAGRRTVVGPGRALPANADAEAKAAYAAMKGKRLPQIGRVEVAVIEESNPRLLGFNSNELDLVDVPRDLVTRVLDDKNRLQQSYAKQGVTMQRAALPADLPVHSVGATVRPPVNGG